jgi:hypothetical protein
MTGDDRFGSCLVTESPDDRHGLRGRQRQVKTGSIGKLSLGQEAYYLEEVLVVQEAVEVPAGESPAAADATHDDGTAALTGETTQGVSRRGEQRRHLLGVEPLAGAIRSVGRDDAR